MLTAALAAGTVALAGTKTIITQTPSGEILDVEKVETPPPDAFFEFAEADLNGDGRIDPQEARNAGIMKFSGADTDGNGYLDQGEYEAAGSVPGL
jgi:hypothetical protein